MQTDRFSFLTAGDGGIPWGVAASVGSLLRVITYGQEFSITVIDGGLPEVVKQRLTNAVADMHGGNGAIRFVPFRWPEGLKARPLNGSLMTYARFFVTEFVDEPFCFYFDADTVFLDSPAELFAAAKEAPHVPVWAVRNYPVDDFAWQIGRQSAELAAFCAEHESARVRDPEAGLPGVYFNNGALLINVPEWRRRDIPGECLALVHKHQFLTYDQDALNCVVRGEWRELPERWNYQLYERSVFPRGCALLHYAGRNKPWHCGYPADARQPFRDGLATGGWPRWRPPTSLGQWLRNTRLRPLLAQVQYRVRRVLGLEGIRAR